MNGSGVSAITGRFPILSRPDMIRSGVPQSLQRTSAISITAPFRGALEQVRGEVPARHGLIDLVKDLQFLGRVDGCLQPFEERHHLGKTLPPQAPEYSTFGCQYHRIPQTSGGLGFDGRDLVWFLKERLNRMDGRLPRPSQKSSRLGPPVLQLQAVRFDRE